MTTRLNPYLHFVDQAREALTFYHQALGGKVEMLTFGQGNMTGETPEIADLIMHGAVIGDHDLTIYASDTPPHFGAPQKGSTVDVSISTDEIDLQPLWDALSDGAEITQPFEAAPWGDRFGMLTDRFGVDWMFNQASPQ